MNTSTHTKRLLICSLSLILIAALISIAHAEPKDDQSHDLKEPTSADIRQDAHAQLTLHLFYVGLGGQGGLDLEFFLNGQTSLGASAQGFATVFSDGNNHQSLFIKRFFGNSFYVKSQLGWNMVSLSERDVSPEEFAYETRGSSDGGIGESSTPLKRRGFGVNIEFGHDWLINDALGLGLSYGAIGTMYYHRRSAFHLTRFWPSFRIFGAF